MPAGFGLTTIVSNKWNQSIGLEFETRPARARGEIVGHWVQRFPCVSQHGLTTSHGSLTLAIVAETNACGFWSNGNCFQQGRSCHL